MIINEPFPYLDAKIVLFIIFYTIKANKRIIQKYCKLVFLLHAPHVSQLSLIWLIYCHTTLVPSLQTILRTSIVE